MFWHPLDRPDYGHQVRVDYDLCQQAKELRLIKREGDRTYRAELTFVEQEPGKYFPATLSIKDGHHSEDIFQYIFNALWASGYRPPLPMNKDEIVAVKDEVIEAKNEHINDLRSVLEHERRHTD